MLCFDALTGDGKGLNASKLNEKCLTDITSKTYEMKLVGLLFLLGVCAAWADEGGCGCEDIPPDESFTCAVSSCNEQERPQVMLALTLELAAL